MRIMQLRALTFAMATVALVSSGRTRDDFEDVTPDLVVEFLRDLTPDILRALR